MSDTKTSPIAPPPGVAPPLRVGTRGSPLALWQARHVMGQLAAACPALAEHGALAECPIRTTGDVSQAAGTRLADIGGKGLFAKEIHEALLDRRIDLAVHSLKDLETELPPGIVLACTLAREDARDALVLAPGLVADPADPFAALPAGAVIGSSSLRRQAQLLHARPDLRVATLRGNVQSRLDRLARGECAATLLALAGLARLGLADRASLVLDPAVMLPAAGQGMIGVTARADDAGVRALLAMIEPAEARAVATAERALLAALDGSCRTPIGGWARIEAPGRLRLSGLVARGDGSFLLRRELAGPVAEAARIGRELGDALRADSPRDILG